MTGAEDADNTAGRQPAPRQRTRFAPCASNPESRARSILITRYGRTGFPGLAAAALSRCLFRVQVCANCASSSTPMSWTGLRGQTLTRLAHPLTARACRRGVHQLVQPRPPTPGARRHPAGRVRDSLRQTDRDSWSRGLRAGGSGRVWAWWTRAPGPDSRGSSSAVVWRRW